MIDNLTRQLKAIKIERKPNVWNRQYWFHAHPQGSECSKNMRGVLGLIMKNFAININKQTLFRVALSSPFFRYARWFCWYRLFWNKLHVHFSDLFLFYLHSFDIIKVRFIREEYRKLLRCTEGINFTDITLTLYIHS